MVRAEMAAFIARVFDWQTEFHSNTFPDQCDQNGINCVDNELWNDVAALAGVFATRGVNLTRIESRPTKDLLGKYCFFFDCEGHIAEARVGDALAALHRICADVRFLGSYARVEGEARPLPPGRSDDDFAEAADWLRRHRAGQLP